MNNDKPSSLLAIKSAFLFDVDGTLLDTLALVTQSFSHTLSTFGLPDIPFEMIAKFQGRPLEECYAMIAGEHDPALLCDTHRSFQETSQHLVRIFADTIDTLERLHAEGKHIAAISTRSRRTLPGSLSIMKIDRFFDLVVAAEDVTHHKPHPEPVMKALEHFGIKPESAVMIGDTTADVHAGKAAGVATVGVTFGFEGQNIRNAGADYVIESLSELVM